MSYEDLLDSVICLLIVKTQSQTTPKSNSQQKLYFLVK